MKSTSLGKLRVLAVLRARGPLSLSDLARALKVSKPAILKHLKVLEDEGLVERAYLRRGRGRPAAVFKVSGKAAGWGSEGVASIALEALSYIEEVLGREHVSRMLWRRYSALIDRYKEEFKGLSSEGKVERLSRLRDSDGYMARWRKISDATFELVEENCPILLISQRYNEACLAESRLFSALLGAEVEATHRVVEGHPTCRFLIRFNGRRRVPSLV